MNDTQKLDILLVDDKPENLLALEAILESPDLNIIKAVSGNEALGLMLEYDFALVLLDVQMPEMDGFETAELMRSSEKTKRIPIIFVTAISKEDKHVFKGYETGAVDYLFKPLEPHIIKGKVNVFLELHRQKLQLEELNQLKTKFLGIAAHDLRNPLVTIRGFSEMLLGESMGQLSEDQREFLTSIHDIAQDMLALLNDLLDISMIESGKIELHFAPGSLKVLVEKQVRINEIVGKQKKMSLHANLEDLPQASFDANRISQVVDNLISNAIKFSPPGSNVYVSLNREGGMARVSVRDEGPGLPPEDQTKLFGEFQKLSVQPTGGEKSTGLGLSIAKRAVEAHRGSMEVKSQVGVGSTFSFTIPLEVSR
jgi:signal transduction histidine kinase